MKLKHVLISAASVILLAAASLPVAASAAPAQSVDVNGIGQIASSQQAAAPAEEVPSPSAGGSAAASSGAAASGVGNVTKTSSPKTGDYSGADRYFIALLSSLIALILLLSRQLHRTLAQAAVYKKN